MTKTMLNDKPNRDAEIESLLREILQQHADFEAPEYNHCDADPCLWCQRAKSVLGLSAGDPLVELPHKPASRTEAVKTDIVGFYSCATVPAIFAEKLERELDQIARLAKELEDSPLSRRDQLLQWAKDREKQP